MSESNGSLEQGQVLADVRRALGRTVTLRPEPLAPFVEPAATDDSYALLARFSKELRAVGGRVYRVYGDSEVSGIIAEICHAASGIKVALSGAASLAAMDLAAELNARGLSSFITADAGSSGHDDFVAQLATCDAGVTAVDYAIAETGTIVLSSDELNALLVSLLPTIHIALLRPQQVSASLGEVISLLNVERVGPGQACRSASFITGPSRTSDVELTLSIGVHGPKELHVIIVGD